MRKAVILASVAVAAWASLASAESGAPARSSHPPDECFNAHFVSGFSAPDTSTVYVRVGVKDVYRLKLFAPCLDVDWNMRVGLKSTSGSDWICRGFDAVLIVPNRQLVPQRCPVSDVHKLSPAEVAALPKRDRP
jgi:hypothetical protein